MALDKILQGFKDIADNQACLNEEAMICAQRINMNGLKRLHKHKSHEFHEYGLCIDNFAQDYGMEVKKTVVKGGFTASDLKDHLKKCIVKLEADIATLKKLNYEFIKECGMEYGDGCKMQAHLSKLWIKMKIRWMPRFEFTKWSPEDIIEWDKWLHDKTRCLEEHKHHHHGCPYCYQHGHKI